MHEFKTPEGGGRTRGCLVAAVGAVALALLSPFVAAIRTWRSWRRGSEVRSSLEVTSVARSDGSQLQGFDLSVDAPIAAEPELRRRLTDTVIRVAEALRRDDDVYHLVYRLPWDEEATAIPVGPQMHELGERFSLVQSQGALLGRTAVWLTTGRHRALAEVIDPLVYDPESEAEPHTLQRHPDVRWSMATARARNGPSFEYRLIITVPRELATRIAGLVERLC